MSTLASSLRRGRHRRPAPFTSLLVLAMAALAVFVAIGGLAGVFSSSASASTTATAIRVSAGYATDRASDTTALSRLSITGRLAAAHRLAAAVTAQAATAAVYQVRAGDTISSVAQLLCGTPADWTGIYAASRKAHVTAWNANDLTAGQRLVIECYQSPGMAGRAPLPPPVSMPATPAATVTLTSTDTGTSVQTPRSERATTYQAPAQPAYQAPVQPAYQAPATYHGSSSMQSCIISRESGGNSQVMNSTNHYGLYQFSYSTWVGSGGNAADFGHASVAEQNQVFYNAVAARGYSDWVSYDGC